MFEKMTDSGRKVIVLAQEEAKALNHNYIGTEHVLLGLMREEDGVAAKALESLGVKLKTVHEQVTETIGRGEVEPIGHIPFTPRAKKVLELALREALQLGHGSVGTEHILLGIIREGQGVAAQILVRLGADLNRVRQQVIQLLDGYQPRVDVKVGAATPSLEESAAVADMPAFEVVSASVVEVEPPRKVFSTIERTGQKATISLEDESGEPIEILAVSVRFRESDGVIRTARVRWPHSKKPLTKQKPKKSKASSPSDAPETPAETATDTKG